jgi:hypothetical protein
MKTIALSLGLLALTAAPLVVAEETGDQSLKGYTCWSMLTEPEENAGLTELFYLGYVLGSKGIELKDEAAYKQAVADVIARCRNEPDLTVIAAFEAVLTPR